ncbi:24-hydroxycholesterol 7-alpha-hydroxylase isoform X1 [Lacerta agilis]|uniref:24-hydroxycholesterol 7-alpha-hydroxylase isoform X1 n=1 Tax=Lacerta agilis TaxID=80427 RepID=UPI00141A5E97|nr:24-hydroxycholesterol 7-alpha-hydroxylase isoform X1 [Lacerta agilis]XP_033001474.1 24-hydroxycholesterol 7-alpha-hydroxylase isoform X1 [Lacerta agilis]
MEIILALLFTVVLGFVVKLIFFPFRNSNEPPCIHGCIPWFGAAFQFGKAPLEFIRQAQLKYGPVFTVYMLGKRYTFVTDGEGFQAFCTSKDVDFEQAVQQSVQRTASIPEEIFYKNRSRIYIMVKGRLGTSNLRHMPGSLCQELQKHMEDLGHEGTEELRDLVRHIMFPSTVNTLFGKDIFLTTKDNVKEFEEHYQNFDDDFEYATQLPKYFLKKWSKSKKWLLKSFEKVVLHAEETNPSDDCSKTLWQHVLDTLQGKTFSANYGLLLLWASQANAIPVSFWTLAFILSQPSVYKKVMDELEPVYRKSGKENIQLSEDDLKKFPFIKWCILETIRLRAPGAIIKKVIAPMTIQNFVIPPGDLLALSPYWIHRNPKYFPEPNTFKPDRWKEANLEKNVSLEGFVAFGGGAHQCPGRWFAIMEIQILVATLLCKYKCHLLDPLPKESLLHLVGTQQPEGPCRIQYKLRT